MSELVVVFGYYCCVNWCVSSLVWGSIRVAVAVYHIAQHATLHSIAQHLCALQHNATKVITYISSIVLTTFGGQLGYNNFGVILARNSN